MRKIRILIIIAVVLAVIGVTSPWLDGIVAESHFETFIANLNKTVQVPMLNNQVSLKNYHRGWFKSTATLEFKTGANGPDKTYTFKVVIHHGPLLFKGQYPTIGLSVIKLVPVFSKETQLALDKITENLQPKPDYVTTVTLNFLSNASLHFSFPAGRRVDSSAKGPVTLAWKEIDLKLEFDEKLKEITHVTDFKGFDITEGKSHLSIDPFHSVLFLSRDRPEALLWDFTALNQLVVQVQLGKIEGVDIPGGIKQFSLGPSAYNFEFSPKKALVTNFLQFGGLDMQHNASHLKLEPFTFSVDVANSKPENFSWLPFSGFDTAKVQWRSGGLLMTEVPPDIKEAKLGPLYFYLQIARLKPESLIWLGKTILQFDDVSFVGQTPNYRGADFKLLGFKSEAALTVKQDALIKTLSMRYAQLTLPEVGSSGPFELATTAQAKVTAVAALLNALKDKDNSQALNAALTLLAKTGASLTLDTLQLKVPEGQASAQGKLTLPANPNSATMTPETTGPDFFKRFTLDVTASAPVAWVKKFAGEGHWLTDQQAANLVQKEGNYVAHLTLKEGELRLNDKPLLPQPAPAAKP